MESVYEQRVAPKSPKNMYPSWAQLGDPEYEGTNVHYLDMPIWQPMADATLKLHSKLYDKKASTGLGFRAQL